MFFSQPNGNKLCYVFGYVFCYVFYNKNKTTTTTTRTNGCERTTFPPGGIMPAGGGPHAAIRQKPTPAGACDGGALLRPAGMNGVGGGTYIFWRHEESPMLFPAP